MRCLIDNNVIQKLKKKQLETLFPFLHIKRLSQKFSLDDNDDEREKEKEKPDNLIFLTINLNLVTIPGLTDILTSDKNSLSQSVTLPEIHFLKNEKYLFSVSGAAAENEKIVKNMIETYLNETNDFEKFLVEERKEKEKSRIRKCYEYVVEYLKASSVVQFIIIFLLARVVCGTVVRYLTDDSYLLQLE